MKKTVIFDLDGVQADTEPLHRESCRALLRLLHLDESIVSKAYTRSKREFWSETAKEYGLPFTADELTRREFALLIEIIEKSGLRPTDGLCETLENLRAAGIVCAVASSSDRVYVHTVLETLGLKKYFSAIACGDEVAAANRRPMYICAHWRFAARKRRMPLPWKIRIRASRRRRRRGFSA